MTTVPHWMLRRFAVRSLNVLERHKDREVSLGVYMQTLGKSAPRFIEAYARASNYEVSRSDKLQGRHKAVELLLRKMRSWLASLANDIENLDRTRYGDKANVPEEVIADAQELLDLLVQREEAGIEMPFYIAELRTDLQAALDAASAEIHSAGGSNAMISELRQEVREAAAGFQKDLIAFRRSLRAFLSTSHPDYQKLRVTKGQTVDPEDEEDAQASTSTPADASDTPIGVSVHDEKVVLEDDEDDELLDQAS